MAKSIYPSETSLYNNDFWGKLPEEVKQLVINAKTELDMGKGIPHEDVMANIRNRFLPQE